MKDDSSHGFKKMGGSSNSDPSPARRWVVSQLMRRFADPGRRERARSRAERKRRRSGAPHRVEYFHQVEDPYSHLAAQVLEDFAARYDVELVPHLVTGPPGNNAPEPELLLPYSQHDCELIASHLGLEFPAGAVPPNAERIAIAQQLLEGSGPGEFGTRATTVGRALWSTDDQALSELATHTPLASRDAAAASVARGNARREALGHYSGATFYYGGEWYWGIDRLFHLERRLMDLGARREPGESLLVPRPGVERGPRVDDGRITLEIYPSIRSPYSSIVFDTAVELARALGVKLVVRPLLPMVMRGAPVTFTKGKYIFFDTTREAELRGMEWGDLYDPIGAPVRHAFALFPWADAQDKGVELVSHFMRMAWREGVNMDRKSGLRKAVEAADLDWAEAERRLRDTDWEAVIEENRQTVYRDGIWGVPSFRVIDENGKLRLSIWGQDRLWLVSRVIQEILAER